jgi:hypothetical protein
MSDVRIAIDSGVRQIAIHAALVVPYLSLVAKANSGNTIRESSHPDL